MQLFTQDYVLDWLRALVLTQAVEAPIYRFAGKVPWWAALLPSMLTHPFVWFAFPRLMEAGASYTQMAAAAELFAWLVEAAFFRMALGMALGRGLALSLLANGASVCAGLAIHELLGR